MQVKTKDPAATSCRITRRVEFDAGHRVPSHHSKCRNAHGHRYTMFATVEGPVQAAIGHTDDGMVTDFGDLKTIMMGTIGEPWDHAFLVCESDLPMRNALSLLGPQHKTVVLPCIPTAENLAQLAFYAIAEAISHLPNVKFKLVEVTIQETPNCTAVYPAR